MRAPSPQEEVLEKEGEERAGSRPVETPGTVGKGAPRVPTCGDVSVDTLQGLPLAQGILFPGERRTIGVMHSPRVPDTGELDLFFGATILFALAVGTVPAPWLLGVVGPALIVGGTYWHHRHITPRIGVAGDQALRTYFERLIGIGACVALLGFAWIAAGLSLGVIDHPLVLGGMAAVLLGLTARVAASERFAVYSLALLLAAGLTQLSALRLSPFVGAAVLMLAFGVQRLWLFNGRRLTPCPMHRASES